MVTIWIILQFLASLSFWFPAVLFLMAAIRKPSLRHSTLHGKEADFGIIVTAFQQIDLIKDVVDSILKSNYQNYIVYIVADDCDISTLQFKDPRIVVLRPEHKLASNTKSHFYAIDRFQRDHDVLTIIDSDNLVHPNYLFYTNEKFQQGFKAIQGVRSARNLNTVLAQLDEAGDMFYRFIDRKLLYESGSSASLAGSGMSFHTELYSKMLREIEIDGAGFDKVLQYELVKSNTIIAFCESAIVWDGKTSKGQELVKQRARWLNTWFKYWILSCKLLWSAIIQFSWNQFAFSMMLFRPPLFILFFLSFIINIINLILFPELIIIWVLAVFVFIALFFTALKSFNASKTIYGALWKIPKFVYFQVLALFKAKAANKISVATKHDINAYKNN